MNAAINNDLIKRYSGPAPRYTSYPTAPHFHAGVDGTVYGNWLKALRPDQTLSLYIHIPYCDRLCWFCGCTTKQTNRYEPLTTYLAALDKEIETIAALVDPGCKVTALHFGGGSPTMVRPEDMITLNEKLRHRFNFATDAEISVEMDPNDLDEGRYDALAAIGMTRASIGVQDFDEKVQKAINREQTFEQTRSVVEAVRARGVTSVNCDVLYGLPFQTVGSIERTIDDVLSLSPDRIALFGYAHVPWMKTHQRMIDENALPDVGERFKQMSKAADQIAEAGYRAIGIDHFAKPDDLLAIAAASGTMRRNFQGYTADTADALIGLGASSIGQLPQGYVQNTPATAEYQRQANAGNLATVRGFELSTEDRVRARLIELLMCDFALDLDQMTDEFGIAANGVIEEAICLAGNNQDGLIELEGRTFRLTEKGKPFVRSVAAHFDTYLNAGKAAEKPRHSLAV